MFSKDEAKTRNVIKAINAMDTIEAVKSYTDGDTRQDVIDAANLQIDFIKSQGPVTGSQEPGSGGPGQGNDKADKDTLGQGDKEQGPENSAFATSNSELPKQGQQTGPITQHTSEFKGPGVQGTKGAWSPLPIGERADSKSVKSSHSTMITGHDIIEALDEKALKESRARASKGAPEEEKAAKTAAEIRQAKGVVTCEDVLEKMRTEGKTV